MKFIIQIFLCSVIGGMAMDCKNNGSSTLSSCQNNPNIRIEKRKNKNGDIKSYRLLLHFQNTWWAAMNDKWIECKDLCKACKSLPGQNKTSCDSQCEGKVDMFLNSFCANATPTTLISTMVDKQTMISISVLTETVVNIKPTTVAMYTTIRDVQRTVIVSTIATTIIELVTITPTVPITTIVSTAIVTVSPTCTPKLTKECRFCQATVTTTAYPSCIHSDPEKTSTELIQLNREGVSVSNEVVSSVLAMKFNTAGAKQAPGPTIALGSLTGVFLVVLAVVIVGWVWTYWTMKKRGTMDISSNNTTVIINTDKDERYFKNPIYNTVNPPDSHRSDENGDNGQVYNVLNRGELTGHRPGRAVVNNPGDENYSKLGLCDTDTENNYQLLDDKEDLDSKINN